MARNRHSNDLYHDYEVKVGGDMSTQGAFPAIMARVAGFTGSGVEPHPDYPGGFKKSAASNAAFVMPGGVSLIVSGALLHTG